MPGGVCAVLDYDVEVMAEYVAEMTTRLTSDKVEAPVAFRKFISQILSSTRLPSTTILLGMNYLAKRINMMSMAAGQPAQLSEGEIWRMLTVALLLGSKFLDDNTFQNRSWAEVSGIPVRELNTLEFQWMQAIDWHLYVNLDYSHDYKAWLKSWEDWSNSKKRHHIAATRPAVGRERMSSLSPISPLSPMSVSYDTEMARSCSDQSYALWHQQQVAEYERLSSMKRAQQVQQQGYRPRQPSWTSYQGPWSGNSPLTPPDSGYGTPDYVNSAASVNAQYNDWFSQQTQHSNRAVMNNSFTGQQQYQQPGNHHAFHSRTHSSYPYNMYGDKIWEHNPVDCNGLGCTAPGHHKRQPYFGMAQSYGQPVMG